MSDPSSPGEPHESSTPDEARTAKIDFGHPQASPPNTPWSAPREQTTDPLPVGWGVPSPEAGWTPLPGGGWSPPPRQEATWSAPPPPDAESAPPHPSPNGAPRRHRFARIAVSALLLGAAVLLGAVIAHQFWPTPNATVSQTRPGGNSGSGSSNGFPFGIGGGSGSGSSGSFPFGGGGVSSGGSTSSASGAPKDVNSIASKVDPALVDINVTLGAVQSAQGSATGIVLNSSGLVLTNNHVIDGATAISATDLGNGRSYTATVVGYDPTQDVALIQLQGASGLTTAQLGDSSTVTVHQAVVAIGNAGGLGGTPSAAGGSIVALDQQITARDALDGTSEKLSGLIRTNADIQPGDSGGPLVNTAGQVIGLDTAASDGYSFGSLTDPAEPGICHPGRHRGDARRADRKPRRLGQRAHRPDRLPGRRAASGRSGWPQRWLRFVELGRNDLWRGARHAGGSRRPDCRCHDRLGRRSAGRLAERLDASDRRLQARRQGHDRLERPIGRATHEHGAACLGTGPLRTANI